MRRIANKHLLFFTLVLILLILPKLEAELYLAKVDVKIFRDGWVKVVEAYTTSREFVFLELPESSEVAAVLGDGEPLPYKVSNNTIYIETRQKSEIKVIYYTQSFTSKIGDLWTIQLDFNTSDLTVEFPPGAIIAGLSAIPELVVQQDSSLVFRFSIGNVTLRYYLKPLLTETGEESEGMAPMEEKVKDQLEKEKPEASDKASESGEVSGYNDTISGGNAVTQVSRKEDITFFWYLLSGFAILIAIPIVLIYKMKKASKLAELSEEEADILQFLRKMGGRAYQSDIMRALGLPKTSTWRYIKRLEEKDLVKVEKIGGKNLVILK